MKNSLTYLLAFLIILSCAPSCMAQAGNDFFGGNNNAIPGTNAAADALNNAADAGFKTGDFTDDEKRMQQKYRDRVKHAKELIKKADSLMTRHKDPNNQLHKKGKVLKLIAEKDLAELTANNPFAPSELIASEPQEEAVPEKKSRFAFLKKKPKKEKSKEIASDTAQTSN